MHVCLADDSDPMKCHNVAPPQHGQRVNLCDGGHNGNVVVCYNAV
jgi:hypothetical protein